MINQQQKQRRNHQQHITSPADASSHKFPVFHQVGKDLEPRRHSEDC